ncbi:TPA: transcriptional regulator, partial [Neisseria meningitidis]
MSQVHETEILQLIADVMRDTGIRIDADDPIVAMLFAQKRELAQFLQQSGDEQNAQRERFLADFQT